MDIYCKFCREPWDMYELHGLAKTLFGEDTTPNYHKSKDLFYKFGCAAFGQGWDGIMPTEATCKPAVETEQDKTTRENLAMLQELLGDDVDGLAALSEDFRYVGMLDV